jgi:hypothetical protein
MDCSGLDETLMDTVKHELDKGSGVWGGTSSAAFESFPEVSLFVSMSFLPLIHLLASSLRFICGLGGVLGFSPSGSNLNLVRASDLPLELDP